MCLHFAPHAASVHSTAAVNNNHRSIMDYTNLEVMHHDTTQKARFSFRLSLDHEFTCSITRQKTMILQNQILQHKMSVRLPSWLKKKNCPLLELL